jgi:hypothetical protein
VVTVVIERDDPFDVNLDFIVIIIIIIITITTILDFTQVLLMKDRVERYWRDYN